jgi:excisionase family DNA binding protein
VSGRLLTTRQVGELLGLSPAAVLRRWRAGELPGYRLGSNVLRFAEADVEAFLLERRRDGRSEEDRATDFREDARPAVVLPVRPTSDPRGGSLLLAMSSPRGTTS